MMWKRCEFAEIATYVVWKKEKESYNLLTPRAAEAISKLLKSFCPRTERR